MLPSTAIALAPRATPDEIATQSKAVEMVVSTARLLTSMMMLHHRRKAAWTL
jgi:hypothetical protein